MGRRRTYDPGEWVLILETEGLNYHFCGSYFRILVGDVAPPDAYCVPMPDSGRVSISEFKTELDRAKSYRASLATSSPAEAG